MIESVLRIVQWQANRNDNEVNLLCEARATFPEKGGQRESDKHIHYRLCSETNRVYNPLSFHQHLECFGVVFVALVVGVGLSSRESVEAITTR